MRIKQIVYGSILFGKPFFQANGKIYEHKAGGVSVGICISSDFSYVRVHL